MLTKLSRQIVAIVLAQIGIRGNAEEVEGAVVNVDTLLATVRKEAWNETFRIQCVDCAEGDEPIFSKEARWYYHELSGQEIGCSASKLRIAALEALTEK